MFRAEVEGGEQMVRTLRQLTGRALLEPVGRAQFESANAIIADAVQLAPFDEGVLRDSGIVQEPQIDSEGVSVELGFGGAASDYAIVQHENLNYEHRVGEAKFLETATRNNMQAVQDRIREALAVYYEQVTQGRS